MPAEAKILLIEGKRAEHPNFFAGLTRKGHLVDLYPNGNDGLDALKTGKPDIVIINAASMRTSGRRICKSVHEIYASLPVILIVEKGTKRIDQLDAVTVLELPFTLQKLLNRVKLLLPPEDKNLLVTGPIELDVENNWVRRGEKHSSLTPRLVTLLKEMMEHPGEVMKRTELFQQVWETTYTGDTRTMDVHISWLREAIEDDPRHPDFIKTVRGIGYRLDVEK